MNVNDLVKYVQDAGWPNMSAGAVHTIFGGITAALARDEEVRIADFATFVVARRPPGKGRNPRTLEPIEIPAKRVAKFKPHKALKDALNPAPKVGGRRMSPARGDQRARA